MLIKDLSAADLTRLLRGPGLHLDTGAFTTHLRSNVGALCHPLSEAYADCQVATGPAIDDFRVAIKRGPGWRGLLGRSGPDTGSLEQCHAHSYDFSRSLQSGWSPLF